MDCPHKMALQKAKEGIYEAKRLGAEYGTVLTSLHTTVLKGEELYKKYENQSCYEQEEFQICLSGGMCIVECCHKYLSELVSQRVRHSSPAIKRLYQLEFHMSHQWKQLAQMFRGGERLMSASNVLSNAEAKAYWVRALGNNEIMVPWSTFFGAFQYELNLNLGPYEAEFKAFIDFTYDDYVSPYEFDHFLRWFGPLQGCDQRLLVPLHKGYLYGFLSAEEAEFLLREKRNGSFLFRISKSCPENFALAYKDTNGKIMHAMIHTTPDGIRLKTNPVIFPSLMAFVKGFSRKLLYPCGAGEDVHTRVNNYIQTNIKERLMRVKCWQNRWGATQPGTQKGLVGAEEDEARLCIVCMDHPKETVFLECGHMSCCFHCGSKIDKCPICREEITRMIKVYQN